MRAICCLLCAWTSLGCPPSGDGGATKPGAVSTACAKFGQSCEYAPGKLGTCVTKEGCEGEGCFVCQSQH